MHADGLDRADSEDAVRITAYDFDHYRYVPDYNEFGFSYHEEVFKFYNYVQKEYVQPAFNMDSLYCYSSATNDYPNTAGKSKNGGYFRPNWGLKSPRKTEHRSRTRAVEVANARL